MLDSDCKVERGTYWFNIETYVCVLGVWCSFITHQSFHIEKLTKVIGNKMYVKFVLVKIDLNILLY